MKRTFGWLAIRHGSGRTAHFIGVAASVMRRLLIDHARKKRAEKQLIVGQYLTQVGNDKKQLLPMIKVVEQQSGQKPSQVLADSGYTSEASITESAAAGIDAYLLVISENSQSSWSARASRDHSSAHGHIADDLTRTLESCS